MGFVRHDTTDRALRHHLLHGREVARIAAILVHADDASLLLGKLDQLLRFAERERERFIDHDMMPREQALLRDRMMGRIRSGDDDEIERTRQQLVYATDKLDIGITRIGLAMPLQDGRQAQPFDGSNDRRVKDSPSKSEADESDAECHGLG